MAIISKITCDISGKELSAEEAQKATVVVVQFKKTGKVPGYNGQPEITCIKEMENYEFHISAEKAPMFMEHLKRLFERLKGR